MIGLIQNTFNRFKMILRKTISVLATNENEAYYFKTIHSCYSLITANVFVYDFVALIKQLK